MLLSSAARAGLIWRNTWLALPRQPCHQPNFEGGPPAPRLAGLSYEYLVAVMRSFAADERTNTVCQINCECPLFAQSPHMSALANACF